MKEVLLDGKLCVSHNCVICRDQPLRIHLHTDNNWYAVCPLCTPDFDDDEKYSYDCFCSFCGEFIYSSDEPHPCQKCGKIECIQCEYHDDGPEGESVCKECLRII